MGICGSYANGKEIEREARNWINERLGDDDICDIDVSADGGCVNVETLFVEMVKVFGIEKLDDVVRYRYGAIWFHTMSREEKNNYLREFVRSVVYGDDVYVV